LARIKRTDEVRGRSGECVVNSISGCKNTFASTRRGTASLPGYDFTGIFIVKVLIHFTNTGTFVTDLTILAFECLSCKDLP
jgi:hypothetical protein